MPSWINEEWGGLNLRDAPLRRPPEDSVSNSNVILSERKLLKKRPGLSTIDDFDGSPEGLKNYFKTAVKAVSETDDDKDEDTVYGRIDLKDSAVVSVLGFTTFENQSRIFVLTTHGVIVQDPPLSDKDKKAGKKREFRAVKNGGFPGITEDEDTLFIGLSALPEYTPSFGEKNGVVYFTAFVTNLNQYILFKYDGEYWYRAGLPTYSPFDGKSRDDSEQLTFSNLQSWIRQRLGNTDYAAFYLEAMIMGELFLTINNQLIRVREDLKSLRIEIEGFNFNKDVFPDGGILVLRDDSGTEIARTTGLPASSDLFDLQVNDIKKGDYYLTVLYSLPSTPRASLFNFDRLTIFAIDSDDAPEGSFFMRVMPWHLDNSENIIFGDYQTLSNEISIVGRDDKNFERYGSFIRYGTLVESFYPEEARARTPEAGEVAEEYKGAGQTVGDVLLFDARRPFNYKAGDILTLVTSAVTRARWGLPSLVEKLTLEGKSELYSNNKDSKIPIGAILNYSKYVEDKKRESSKNKIVKFKILKIEDGFFGHVESFGADPVSIKIKKVFLDNSIPDFIIDGFPLMIIERNGLFLATSENRDFGWEAHSFFTPNYEQNIKSSYAPINPTTRKSELNNYSNGRVISNDKDFPILFEDFYDTSKVKGIPPPAKYISFTEDQMLLANTRREEADTVEAGSELHWSDITRGSTIETFHPLDVVNVGRDHQGEIRGISFDRQGIVIMKEREVFYLNGTLYDDNFRIFPTLSDGQGCIAPHGHAVAVNGTAFMSHLGIYFTSRGGKPIELSDKIQPLFTNPKENLDFTKAVMLNSFDEEKLYTWIPAKEKGKGLRGRNGILLVYDYYYARWFIWDIRDASLGMAFYDNDGKFGLSAMGDDGILVPNDKLHDVIKGRAVPFKWHYETSDFYAGYPFLKKIMNRLALINTAAKKIDINVSIVRDWTNQILAPDGTAEKLVYNLGGEDSLFLLEKGLPVSSFRAVRFRLEGEGSGELLLDGLRVEFEGLQEGATDGGKRK